MDKARNKVYLLKAGDFYKIGVTSNDVKTRINQLQTGNPLKVEFVHSVGGLSVDQAMAYEAKLHLFFVDVRVEGEWFKFTSLQVEKCIDLMNFIIPNNTHKKSKFSDERIDEILTEAATLYNENIELEIRAVNGDIAIHILDELTENGVSLHPANLVQEAMDFFYLNK